MSQTEQYLYNTFLRISRSKQNRPFKLRKDFSKFEDHKDYGYVKKLGYFFAKFPHIKIEDFFNAPYYIYVDNSPYYDIKYYTTPKAIKVYGLYVKEKDMEDPDTEYNLQFIKDSLMFIFIFCKNNNLTLDEYINHKNGDLYAFINHLRERKISLYAILGFNGTESRLHEYSDERLQFTLGEEPVKKLASRKISYYNSRKAKHIINQGKKHIKNLLHKINNNL